MSAGTNKSTLAVHGEDDYRAAARRHLSDATVLKARQRYDGAAYLAGYVVECSLKMLIELETGRVERVHDLAGLRDALSRLARRADAQTARFARPLADLLRNSAILAWDPQMRYQASAVGGDQAEQWVIEAHAVYSAAIGGLIMDGVIR